MKVSQGIYYWLEYHKLHSKKSTLKTYQFIKTNQPFRRKELNSLGNRENLGFKMSFSGKKSYSFKPFKNLTLG